MRFLFLICGALWLFAGFLSLAFNVSIVSLPEKIEYIKTATILYFVYDIIVGTIFILSFFYEKHRVYYKKLNNSLFNILRINKFKVPIVAFALKNNLSIEEAKNFLERKNFISWNRLTLTKEGVIIYGTPNGSDKSKKSKVRRK